MAFAWSAIALLLALLVLEPLEVLATPPSCTPPPGPGKFCVFSVSCTQQSPTPFEDAREACRNLGARLCFLEELDSSSGPGTPPPSPSCAPTPLGQQFTWTMDMCTSASNLGPKQRFYTNVAATPTKTCANASAPLPETKMHLRCCKRAAPAYQDPAKKNILWIIVDDLRPDLNVAYGRKKATTPYLDSFALEKGTLVFERAYANSPKCSPSRMSFLTGLSPLLTGLVAKTWLANPFPSSHRILPEFFRDNGYAAYTGGKVFHEGHNNDPNAAMNKNDLNLFWNGTYAINQKQEAYGDPCPPSNNPTVFSRFTTAIPTSSSANDYMCYTATAGQTNLIDYPLVENAHGKLVELTQVASPFLLVVGLYKPHATWKMHRKYVWQTASPTPAFDTTAWTPVDNSSGIVDFFDDFEDGIRDVFIPPSNRRPWDVMPKWDAVDHTTLQAMHSAYHACIAQSDEKIGGLLERLEALNFADNTVVVIMGDHGFHLGELGLFSKYKLFELATRLPFLVRLPGYQGLAPRSEPLRIRKQIELLDLYRTFAGLAIDAPTAIPASVQGYDHSGLIKGLLAGTATEPASYPSDVSYSTVRRCDDPSQIKYNCQEEAPFMKYLGISMRTPLWRYTVWLSAPGEVFTWPSARNDSGILGQELYNHTGDAENLLNYSGADGATFFNVEIKNTIGSVCAPSPSPNVCDTLYATMKTYFETNVTRYPTSAPTRKPTRKPTKATGRR